MKHVNTHIAEQLNNSLRKLATVVAYSNFDIYLKIIQIFISIRNLGTVLDNDFCPPPVEMDQKILVEVDQIRTALSFVDQLRASFSLVI